MKEFDPIAYKKMVKSYQDEDKPTGWFDSIYTDAQGDYRAVFWADLEPNPYLLEWLKNCVFKHTGRKAIVIGWNGGRSCRDCIGIALSARTSPISSPISFKGNCLYLFNYFSKL